jgi:hypothetical protein
MSQPPSYIPSQEVPVYYYIPAHKNSVLFFKKHEGNVSCKRYCAVLNNGTKQLEDTCKGWRILCSSCHRTPGQAEAAFTKRNAVVKGRCTKGTHANPVCTCTKSGWLRAADPSWEIGTLQSWRVGQTVLLAADDAFATQNELANVDDRRLNPVISELKHPGSTDDYKCVYVPVPTPSTYKITDTDGIEYTYERKDKWNECHDSAPPTLPQKIVFGGSEVQENLAFDALVYGVDTHRRSYRLWIKDPANPSYRTRHIAYEAWDGSLVDLEPKPAGWEKAVLDTILRQLAKMQTKGVRYWHVTAENILYRKNDDGTYLYTLGRLDSAQLMKHRYKPTFSKIASPVAEESSEVNGLTELVLVQAFTYLFYTGATRREWDAGKGESQTKWIERLPEEEVKPRDYLGYQSLYEYIRKHKPGNGWA